VFFTDFFYQIKASEIFLKHKNTWMVYYINILYYLYIWLINMLMSNSSKKKLMLNRMNCHLCFAFMVSVYYINAAHWVYDQSAHTNTNSCVTLAREACRCIWPGWTLTEINLQECRDLYVFTAASEMWIHLLLRYTSNQ